MPKFKIAQSPVLFVGLLLGFLSPSCTCDNKAPSLESAQGDFVSPSALDFGDVTVGSSSAKTVVLNNSGSGTLNIVSASVSGDINFAVVGLAAPLAIAAGESVNLKVSFAPTSAGPHTATLTITADTGQTPATVALTGVGVVYGVTVSPASADFGCVLANGSSGSQSITVTNPSVVPETVTVGQVGGSADFQVLPLGAQSLAAGQTLTLSVGFTPTANQAESATFSVAACATCAPSLVTLTGTGATVSLSANPSLVNFGNVPTGTTSSSSVTVQAETQPSSCSLTTLIAPPSMQMGHDGFTVSPVGIWPSSLGGSATAELTVEYTGQAAGVTDSDAVLVAFTVGGQAQKPLAIPVNAGGVAGPCSELVASPASVNFGTVAVGSMGKQTVTLTNQGTMVCDLESIAITKNDALNEFSLEAGATPPLGLGPSAFVTLTVDFAPTSSSAPSARNGELTLTTNDPTDSPKIQLRGSVQNRATCQQHPTNPTTCGVLQPGMALFQPADNYSAPVAGAYTVAVGDFNGIDGDCRTDVALSAWGGNEVTLFSNTGAWTTPGVGFAAPAVNPLPSTPSPDPAGLTSADFNGDGLADFAAALGGSVAVYLSTGNGTFAAPSSYATGDTPILAAADLDGDGKPDLVSANYGDGTVSVLLNTGTGFAPQQIYAVGRDANWVSVADLNGDGKPDIAVANRTDDTVSVLYNAGSGTFLPQVTVACGSQPFAVAAADFDGDGKNDLVVSNYGCGSGTCPSTVSVMLNTGSGFGAPVSFAVGSGPEAVLVGDFNNDDLPDVVVANRAYSASPENTVSVLLNTGSWTTPSNGLAAQITYSVGLNPTNVAAADINGDGRLDLVVANLSDTLMSSGVSSISVLLGTCP